MPWIIDYQHVLTRTRELGLRSVYYNSGAFAHARQSDGREVESQIVGWLGPDDPTIRADLPARLVRVAEPYETNLANRLLNVWPTQIDGPAWVMPKSHWSHELEHGSRHWLAETLERIGLDPGLLEGRTNAAAVAFNPDETDAMRTLVVQLLTRLAGSDFAIVFPHHTHLVTLHHHKQIWWQTTDPNLAGKLASP